MKGSHTKTKSFFTLIYLWPCRVFAAASRLALAAERGLQARGLPELWRVGSFAPQHVSPWTTSRDSTTVPCIAKWILFFFLSSTTLLLPTHLPPLSCTHVQSCNPIDFSPPDSSVHGLFQARILEWVAISFPMQSEFLTTGPLGKPQGHIQ